MTKKITLKNGTRIILTPQKNNHAAAAAIFVETGSEYETKNINGISHFLEHMVFKGTQRRPRPGMIAQEMESLGAENNAETSQEYTCFYAKVQQENFAPMFDLLADMYLEPLLDAEELEKERGVIAEEINMYEDIPMRNIHDVLSGLMYGDQPAGWSIAGPKETIRQIQRNDFVEYMRKHYVAPKTVISLAGNFNEKKVLRQIEGFFAGRPKGKKEVKQKTVEKQDGPATIIKFKESDQAHLKLGLRAFSMFDKRRFALQVLSNILGGGMSSRLWQRVREDMGAAYYVRAYDDLTLDHGYFGVSAGLQLQKTEEVLPIILGELRRTTSELVPAGELQRAKDYMIGNLVLSLETSDQLAHHYGLQEALRHKVEDIEEEIKAIRKVSAAQIRKVAEEVFQNKNLNLAIIGPYKDEEVFKKILHI